MKKITLHIGYNKTGSSAIQSYCNQNRESLMKAGVCYPRAGILDSAHYGISEYFIGHPVKTGVHSEREFLATLKQEISGCGCNNVILSSEYFTIANPDHITRLKATLQEIAPEYQVQAIIYLRRHDLWFESLFNQAEKTAPSPPWEMDIRDYVLHILGTASPECSYLRVINRWAGVCGDGSIIVRPFEAGQFTGGTLITDFFHALGVKLPDDADIATGKHNESLSREVLYAIGAVKRSLSKAAVMELMPHLVRSAGAGSDSIVPADYGTLNNAHRHSIYMFFLPEYNAIARRFMGRTQGGLFIDVPKRPQ